MIPECRGPSCGVPGQVGNDGAQSPECSAGNPSDHLGEVCEDHYTYFDDPEERLEVQADRLDSGLAGDQLSHEVGEGLGHRVQTLGGWTAEDLRERLTDALQRIPHGVEQGGEALEDLLPTSEVSPSLEESVPGVAHLGDDTTRPCEERTDLGPQFLGLLEVAEDDSERLRPG